MNRYRVTIFDGDIIEFNAKGIVEAIQTIKNKGYNPQLVERIEKIEFIEG